MTYEAQQANPAKVYVPIRPDTIADLVEFLFGGSVRGEFSYENIDGLHMAVLFDDADSAFNFKIRFG